jgi:hypothetical protein
VKTILILCTVTLVAVSVFVWRAVARPNRFGAFAGAPRAEVAALIERPADFVGQAVALEGEVTAQCKASGCFFSFRAGANALRVVLSDIVSTLPYREGRRARVEGELQGYSGAYQFYATAVEFQ